MNGRQFGAPTPPERGNSVNARQQPRPSRVSESSDSIQQQIARGSTVPDEESWLEDQPALTASRRDDREPVTQTDRVETQPKKRHAKKSFWRPAVLYAALIVGGGIVGAFVFGGHGGAGLPGVDSGYQAVFLTDGQTYFGRLTPLDAHYLKLTDVYYYKTNSTSSSDTINTPQIVKLGDEIHQPKNEMIIARDQVSFFENLAPNSPVVQKINSN